MKNNPKGLSRGFIASVSIGAIAGFVLTNGNPVTPIIIGTLVGMSVYMIEKSAVKENDKNS
ncbi:MAG: hypothetical protein AB4352_12520 [Hormoscilla sp.]